MNKWSGAMLATGVALLAACAPRAPASFNPGATPTPTPTTAQSVAWAGDMVIQGTAFLIAAAVLIIIGSVICLLSAHILHWIYERLAGTCDFCRDRQKERRLQEEEELKRADEIIREHDQRQRRV